MQNKTNVFNMFTENDKDIEVVVDFSTNEDYVKLTEIMRKLQIQYRTVIQDMEYLIKLKKEALADVRGFCEKIIKEPLLIPSMQNIAEIPNEIISRFPRNLWNTMIKQRSEKYDYIKQKAHKKPWTDEEQRKLENLLRKYPPEVIESNRYRKIAAELGTRSLKQVTSRIQKYFIKLFREGLPVPGRIPKTVDRKRKHLHKEGKYKYLYKPSTFFPDFNVPVIMTDDDDYMNKSKVITRLPETKNESFYIRFLKRIKDEMNNNPNQSASIIHKGYTCYNCREEPIQGIRWNCTQCENMSRNYCTDCIIKQAASSDPHILSHYIKAIHDFNESESDEDQKDNQCIKFYEFNDQESNDSFSSFDNNDA